MPRHVETERVRTLLTASTVIPLPLVPRVAPLAMAPFQLAMRTPLRRALAALIPRLPEGPSEESRRERQLHDRLRGAPGLEATRRGTVTGGDLYGLTARTTVEGALRCAAPGYDRKRRPGALAGVRPARLPGRAPRVRRRARGRVSACPALRRAAVRVAGDRVATSTAAPASSIVLERCERCRLGVAAGLRPQTQPRRCSAPRARSRTEGSSCGWRTAPASRRRSAAGIGRRWSRSGASTRRPSRCGRWPRPPASRSRSSASRAEVGARPGCGRRSSTRSRSTRTSPEEVRAGTLRPGGARAASSSGSTPW